MTDIERARERDPVNEAAHDFCEWFVKAHGGLPYGFHKDIKRLLQKQRDEALEEAANAALPQPGDVVSVKNHGDTFSATFPQETSDKIIARIRELKGTK